MMSDYCLVTVACATRTDAEGLAAGILEKRLAACVQLSEITSFYEWKGVLHKDPEVLMLIKTRRDLYPMLESHISRHHSYEVPEIVQIPIENGLAAYLGWIDEVTR
ncbi:divalent-cation tolerance protein CutA [Desulfococcus sp.]|uniref:divalent-cation tolerance protein CutA n=1 Tax=Desulfococcus sp. TaxID=2025834 RepID=UPI003D147772